jgi:hypothetical protein
LRYRPIFAILNALRGRGPYYVYNAHTTRRPTPTALPREEQPVAHDLLHKALTAVADHELCQNPEVERVIVNVRAPGHVTFTAVTPGTERNEGAYIALDESREDT